MSPRLLGCSRPSRLFLANAMRTTSDFARYSGAAAVIGKPGRIVVLPDLSHSVSFSGPEFLYHDGVHRLDVPVKLRTKQLGLHPRCTLTDYRISRASLCLSSGISEQAPGLCGLPAIGHGLPPISLWLTHTKVQMELAKCGPNCKRKGLSSISIYNLYILPGCDEKGVWDERVLF